MNKLFMVIVFVLATMPVLAQPETRYVVFLGRLAAGGCSYQYFNVATSRKGYVVTPRIEGDPATGQKHASVDKTNGGIHYTRCHNGPNAVDEAAATLVLTFHRKIGTTDDDLPDNGIGVCEAFPFCEDEYIPPPRADGAQSPATKITSVILPGNVLAVKLPDGEVVFYMLNSRGEARAETLAEMRRRKRKTAR